MNRVNVFYEDYNKYCKQEHVGREEMQTFYLHEIALHLAIIADCLEDKKEVKNERHTVTD